MSRPITNSKKLQERSKKVIPHLTGTFTRSAHSFVEGVYPVYAQSAQGSHFTDVDGNNYLDYLCGIGPVTLGYNYQKVNDAIIDQLKNGILFSLPHPLEVELSELISQTIPHAEMVKFEKSGSNVVTGAVRAARYITKRNKIAYCGSGGVWHDWWAVVVSRDGGVPEFNRDLIRIFDYNDIDGLEQIFEDNPNEIAAIVLEPTIFEKPQKDFLKKVRKIADQNNTILILDEIVTGFRFDIGGAQKYFDIKGDFVCFGKGMGNGLPIAAITGTTEFMQKFDDLWVSSTNNPETLSMAGTKAVINEMREKSTISHCWKIGTELFTNWNRIAEENNLNIKMIGYPIRMKIECKNSQGEISKSLKALVLQEMVKNGIFFPPGQCFLSYSHSNNDITYTLQTLENICRHISNKVKNDNYSTHLEGIPPQTVWSMKMKSTKKIK